MMIRQTGRKRKTIDCDPDVPSKVVKINEIVPAQSRVGLNDLPLELLYTLFVEAGSTHLPLINRRFWQSLVNAPDTVRFEYLAGLWDDLMVSQALSHKCSSKSKRNIDFVPRVLSEMCEQRKAPAHRRRIKPSLPILFECCSSFDGIGVDVFTFVTSFAVCTRSVLRMFLDAVNSCLRVLPDCNYWGKSLPIPKRLFRSLQTPMFEQRDPERLRPCEHAQAGAMFCVTDASFVSSDDPRWVSTEGHAFLESLAWSKSEASEVIDRIGPVPPPEQLDVMLDLLDSIRGDPSSYKGFPLVMAVHHRAYALINLLMMFGADPAQKRCLAIQVAINNGDLHAIRIMASSEPDSVSIPAAIHLQARISRQRCPARFTQDHLQLAIKNKRWAIVDFLFEHKRVVPDMACLRLIEKNRT